MNAFRFTDARRHVIGITGATAFAMACALPARSGVTTDGTLGQGGALPGPNYQITADLGQQVGGNLFHSFGQFSLHSGESATFSGPYSVNNIIGRVTGGEASLIDGTIRSTIPGANLYLLNPAGLLFGENATLDVTGSVHVSTADYLRLGDGGRFDARTPADSVLTVAPVAAFGFLGPPAPITLNGGFLRMPDGQTLSLIGGDLTLTDATLYAPAGRINLAAVGSAGEVVLADTNLAMHGFGRLGAITVERTTSEHFMIDELELGDVDASGAGGGTIFIRGGQFVGQGRSRVQSNTTGERDGRGISVEVERLTLTDGSRIQSGTTGSGRGGDINVIATEDVMIDGAHVDPAAESFSASGLITNALSDSSQAGNITLGTTHLSLTRGGAITSVALENSRSGNLNIVATESIHIDALHPDLVGNRDFAGLSAAAARYPGDIRISTTRLILIGGGSVNTFSWSDGEGRGGNIDITASESVTLNGPHSAIFADAYGGGSMNAGDITLTTASLSLTGGGMISSSTWGLGHGGNINIIASESTTIVGEGYDPLTDIHFFSGVFSNSCGDCSVGNAGNITLTTGHLLIDAAGGGDSTESTGLGARADNTSGGNITVNADHVRLLNGGEISSSVAGSEGDDGGGNVTINGGNIVALNGSTITAQANQGRGGNILINAEVFLHDATSTDQVLNASSRITGNDGTVQNNAPNADLSGNLTVLPTNYLSAADQLGNRCGTSDPDSRSRFIAQGRGGLLPGPDDPATVRPVRCRAAPPSLARSTPPALSSAPTLVTSAQGFGNR